PAIWATEKGSTMSIDLTGPRLDADGGGGGEAGATLEGALETAGAADDGAGSPTPVEGADASTRPTKRPAVRS
ncbi:hypothetical protein LCGC14_2723270, partial [marine sediment metagenome]